MKHLKKLTLLHSNDLHGDFLVEKVDDKLVGGVSMLSGYVNKGRREEENVVYAIAGDMFQGSLIDSEYKGVSTIEIMNLLAPDVVTIGNHEVDYGLAHLLFLEKCANFPIINANLYLKHNGRRLFHSHRILEIDGMKILFIGILTEEVLQKTKLEKLIGTLVDIREAAAEVGRICDAYQTEDIDFTVLLTHVGIEADQQLAAILDPRWGVDLIIGGHSHTLLEKPIEVNGIPIVQAASGTDQIGRFDIMVDTDLNSIDSYTWQLIPITPEYCPEDEYARVSLNLKRDPSIAVGAGYPLGSKVVITPSELSGTEISFDSSDYSIATVDENGWVIGINAGQCTITVTVESTGESASCTVNVFANDELRLTLNDDSYLDFDSMGYLRRIKDGKNSVAEIRNQFSSEALTFVSINENALEESDLVGTGAIIKLTYDDEVVDQTTVIMTGDFNGDGIINTRDVSMMSQNVLQLRDASEIQILAVDVNGDGDVNVRDCAMMSRYLAGKEDIA